MMYDDLDFTDEAPPVIDKPLNNKNSNFKRYAKAPEIVTDQAYVPITFYVDQSFPQSVKDTMRGYISKLLNNQYTVRVNADDKDFTNSIKELSDTHLELYTAWKNFNEIDTKHYYNTETSKLIAAKFFQGWDKVSDPVKAFLSRNARLLFGDKNNSCTLALVTWSEDGASKTTEVTKATGKSSHIIKMAAYYAMPIFNLQKTNSDAMISKVFNLF